MGSIKDQRKLFALARGEGRCRANTLVQAANELGVTACLKRLDAGYSSRVFGAQSKLPDRIFLELDGVHYGGGAKNRHGEDLTLQDFAEEVVSRIDGKQRRKLEIDYHLQKLKSLGVKLNLDDAE